jgi:hypothetical protein
MKIVFASVAAVSAAVAFSVGTATGTRAPNRLRVNASPTTPPAKPPAKRARPALAAGRAPTIPIATLNAVVDQYCTDCHNDQMLVGNLSLEHYDVAAAPSRLAASEKMIRKLRAEMMPLPGAPRPGGDTLSQLVATIEQVIDRSAKPNPGTRTFQRLNRAEYENAVRDLIGLNVSAGDWLPLDTKSANFDNIADAQLLSPTLLDAYLNAASAVSRLALGDKNAALTQTTYKSSPFASQHPWDHVEGAPFGTRGGIVTEYVFPADGLYQFRMVIEGGVGTHLEDVDISIGGQRATLFHYEKGVNRTAASADAPLGADLYVTDPMQVRAGQQLVSAAFVRRADGPYEDLIKPHDWSMASNGNASAGTTTPPHLMELTVIGPSKITGISDTKSRRMIYSCRPSKALTEQACAAQIIDRLGTRAYRRPLTKHDRDGLMAFYTQGAKTGGFEEGIRSSLQAMLSSPYFVFRFEPVPANVAPGQNYSISDVDLASRLSFFIWGSIPDDELLKLAQQKKLSEPKTLDRELHRMLADPKAEALASRFGAQWLRLQDLDKVHPDAFLFPDYDQQLTDDMRRETELFFQDIVRNDRSILDFFNANFTYVNERLARHYDIPNISGSDFRRVEYPDSTRRGLLGEGSILVQTSIANRTSPVLRGKWIMEVLMGMPPPPPPPNVPTLDETADGKDGHPLTTRERMELHRKNPTCKTCHQYMDPIGLALDNFDVTGKWRYRENAMLLDTRGNLYDGTPIQTPSDLTTALLKRPIPLVRSFTENLMAYALGRRVEDFDEPTIRAIAKQAETNDYRFSSFVSAVVRSDAFRMKRAEDAVAATDTKEKH